MKVPQIPGLGLGLKAVSYRLVVVIFLIGNWLLFSLDLSPRVLDLKLCSGLLGIQGGFSLWYMEPPVSSCHGPYDRLTLFGFT